MAVPDIDTGLAQAAAHHQAGRLGEAANAYARILAANPGHAEAHNKLGNVLFDAGRLDEAAASYRKALAAKPDYAEAHNNLGNVFFESGKPQEAMECYRQSLAAKPEFAGAHNSLGTALWAFGRLDEAAAAFRQALDLKPDCTGAQDNLGNVLFDAGKLDEAIAIYRQAIVQRPGDPHAYGNLGIALWDQGKLDEAEAVYRRILQMQPNDIVSLNNLATLLLARGKPDMAFGPVHRSLQVQETPQAKRIFVDVVAQLRLMQDNDALRALLVRALNEAWARPSKLAQASADLIKHHKVIGPAVARAAASWPTLLPAAELFGRDGLAVLAGDQLLAALLTAAPNVDLALERFLTMARAALLESAMAFGDDAMTDFACTLAQQCFVNEYVFFAGEAETAKLEKLRPLLGFSLESGSAIPAHWIAIIASYQPLGQLAFAAKLLARSWPAPVAALLRQQLCEPAEEEKLRAAIPRLTAIADNVSQEVARQYEENPYPRWVRLPPPEQPTNLLVYLARKFPLVKFHRPAMDARVEILIAGCGTGQQSIASAQRTSGAQVLAIDLSLNSLAYAARKTREMGVEGIEYAQADILELGSLTRRFDLIESVGVLHHMKDPWAGLKVLLGLLKPGGFMKLDFYSAVARRNIVEARNFIAERGYSGTPDEVRLCRQQFLDRAADFPTVVHAEDFSSVSLCRDLIFHVQEHRMTLEGIAAALRENGLDFLGFEIAGEETVLPDYRARFPDDPAAVNLAHWQAFENDNPGLFNRTYQFWVQAAAR